MLHYSGMFGHCSIDVINDPLKIHEEIEGEAL